MNIADLILKKLEDEAQQAAEAAVRNPQGRDAFEYGRMCGVYGGLQRAFEIVGNIYEEKERQDDDL